MKIAISQRGSPTKGTASETLSSGEAAAFGANAKRARGNNMQVSGAGQQLRRTRQQPHHQESMSENLAEGVELSSVEQRSNILASEEQCAVAELQMNSSAEMCGEGIDASAALYEEENADTQPLQRGGKLGNVKVRTLGGSAFGPDSNISRTAHQTRASVKAEAGADTGDEGERIAVEVTEFDDELNEALADESAALGRFECTDCGIKFARHVALRQHARKTHATRIGVQCEVCGKTFRYLGSMPRHMMLHAAIKPFVCSVCGVQFAQKGDLRRHERLHTGERPFSCPECSATFNREYSLKKHLHVHTGEQPYACTVCERRFSSRSSVTRHFHTHAHAHAALASAATYQTDEQYQLEGADAGEIELAADSENGNVGDDQKVDEAYVEMGAGGVPSSDPSKRRYKQASRARAVMPNDEADNEALDAAWLLSTR